MTSRNRLATRAVRAAIESDCQYGAVMPPLYLSSTFSFDGLGGKRSYDYTRSGNPTRDALGDAISELEGGAGAVVTGSGMSAIHLVLHLLEPDDLLVAPKDCYGGTYRLLTGLAGKGHFRVEFADLTQPDTLRAIGAAGPRMVFVETPSNPLLRITDIAAVRAAAAIGDALLVVDNTFLSPALQNPIAMGADVVLHSTTKYLNGHSDIVGGAVVAADAERLEQLAWWANCVGSTGAPFDAYQTLRGLRTLAVRMKQHESSATALATALSASPGVDCVYYPGLPHHPGHAVAARQQSGFGGMLSFELAGGEAAVRLFVERLELFSLAESLGGVESLVCHPESMTHAAMTEDARHEAGIVPGLVRLSVGLEDTDDLLADVLQALDHCQATLGRDVCGGAAVAAGATR